LKPNAERRVPHVPVSLVSEDIMAHANPIQIQKYLKGVDYPANKAALIENAKNLGADESICASLEQLPDEDFQTPADVSEAFKGPSEDKVEAKQAEPEGKAEAGPARGGGHVEGGKAFLLQEMQHSLAEIELCMLALRKSVTPEIRKFALSMIDEHSMLGQQMEQLAKKKRLDTKLQLEDQHADMLDKLARVSTRDFDRRFVAQNLREHENDLKVFKHYAAEEKDPDIKSMAEAGEKMYTKHLKMVKDLEKKMQGE
jgi:predicted outer membrane protein